MRVAVVGASEDRAKYGNKAVRALRNAGHDVVPINPRCAGAARSIEDLETYSSVADVPGRLDVATLYVHPSVGEQVLDDIAAKGVPELWVNPGAESDSLLRRAQALGLDARLQCSILAVDESPARY